jgi:phage tail-like protein
VSATLRRSPDWLIDQLPVAMVQERFFRGFVSIFQDVATTYLEQADGIGHLTEVDVTPTPMLPWLGSWLGVDVVDPTLDDLRQRQLVATASKAMAWRGTRVGLQAWLEALTQGEVTIDDPGGVYLEGESPMQAPIVRIHTSGTGWMSTAEFARVVLAELPVHLSLELYVDHQLVHPQLEATPVVTAHDDPAPDPVPPDPPVQDDPEATGG